MPYSESTPPLPEGQPSMPNEKEQTDKYGYLIVNDCWFEVPVGETKIGRNGSMCSIVLDDEAVSKEHAVVESEGADDTFIYDAGSTNKTKIGKMMLRPHCRYKINDNDIIKLGSTDVTFRVMDHKVKNSSSTVQSQFHSLGKDAAVADEKNMDPSVSDEMPILNNKSSIVDIPESFKSPSIILSRKVKQVKKYYYIPSGESSPAVDIFSQATQCEVTDSKKESSFESSDSQLKSVNNDEIFNLSTQCEYAGDLFQQKNQNNSGRSLFQNSGTAKSKEVIHYDFNDSGTFDFVKETGTRNPIPAHMHEALSDDIFELATQCSTKLNDSIGANELNFKNIINKPENFAESLKMKLEKNSNEQKKKLFPTNDELEERENNLISISDGLDEELTKLMKVNSPVINSANHSPIIFKNNIMEVRHVDNLTENDVPDEVFLLATQVSSALVNQNDVNERVQKVTVTEVNNEREREKRLEMVKNHLSQKPEEKRVVNNGVVFKEPENVFSGNMSKVVPDHDEDMILTQVFGASQNVPQKNSAFFSSSNSVEPTSEAKDRVFGKSTSCERDDNGEDLRPTQPFTHFGDTPFNDKHNHRDITHCTQDDIATQIFSSRVGEQNQRSTSGEANDGNEVLSVIVTGGSPKTVPKADLVSSDSGDETESDLEVKVCLQSKSAEKKEKNSLSVKADTEACSSRKLFDSEHAERPSSASSDKTVSDLDIAEFQGASSIVFKTNNGEDFIATQIFRSSSTNANTVLDIEKVFSKKSRNDCEDCISTQPFPSANVRKTPSPKPGKTESNLVVDTRAVTGYVTIQVSTEEDNCNIEENSNESESLLKEIEEFSPPSPVLVTTKQLSLTPRQREGPESESSLTLSPSHPAFEAFSEIDELIGNSGRTNDKSDSGIGAENLFERDVENGKEAIVPQVRVEPNSDETDCEEELEAMKNLMGRQETFVISKPGSKGENSPLITSRSEDISQTTSNPTSRGNVERPTTTIGKSTGKRTCLPKDSTKREKGNDSPLKRTLLRNSDEGVQKKRVKSVESRRKKPIEDLQADEIILTQSLKLRNRVVRQRKITPDLGSLKKETATDRKTPGRNKSNSGSAIGMVPRVRTARERPSAVRKLTEEFQSAEEEGKKRSSRPRRSNDDKSKEEKETVTKIVFTGFESDWHDKIIPKLGGERVNHLDDGHVLVTDRVRRTVKFLSAVALGLPIVSPKWLIASAKDMKFLDPWDFLLEDKQSEERWGFNLKASLEKWKKHKLLNGYTVFATESTRPPLHEILSIAKCCGGFPMTARPEVWPEKSIVLTCIEDKKWWPPYKCRQVKIVHYEFLLSGVLRHFMDFKSYKLR